MFDIHSHILPGVDDGAADTDISLKLLQMMQKQGVTDVVATPHFYAMHQEIGEFERKVSGAYLELMKKTQGMNLPRVSIGSEVFYFNGIGRSEGIKELTLCGSQFILLELPNCKLDSDILRDIADMYDRLGLITILAHLERYSAERGYNKVLEMIDNETVFAQINASSLFSKHLKRPAMKLIKQGYASFLASDAHSPDGRPPMMKQAIEFISQHFDVQTAQRFIRRGDILRDRIFTVPGQKTVLPV